MLKLNNKVLDISFPGQDCSYQNYGNIFTFFVFHFFCIRPSPGLLPVLGPVELYMTPTLEVALLSSSRAVVNNK